MNKDEGHPILGLLRKTMLATIGAAALAQEEMTDMVDRVVVRGEIAEREGRALARDLTQRRKRETVRTEERFDAQMEAALMRANLHSKADIARISADIAELNARLDQLNRS